jgi:hypothetical protein
MNDAKLVIFHHIPKTAGTTLREILNRQYGEGQVFETNWYPGERLLAERPFGIYTGKKKPGETWYPGLLTEIAYRYEFFQREAASPIRAIYGFHCEYGLAEYIFQPSETFTFLRHPVDRALSHYYFTVDVPEGLDEAGLEAHLLARIEGNLQTKMLSGPHGAGPLPPPEEMLARAKANLKSCCSNKGLVGAGPFMCANTSTPTAPRKMSSPRPFCSALPPRMNWTRRCMPMPRNYLPNKSRPTAQAYLER